MLVIPDAADLHYLQECKQLYISDNENLVGSTFKSLEIMQAIPFLIKENWCSVILTLTCVFIGNFVGYIYINIYQA